MSRSLIVLPDDSAKPILDAIDGGEEVAAHQNVRLLRSRAAEGGDRRARRGVKVRIMLNPARRSGEDENEESRKQLAAAGIEVIDSNPAFDLTHEKSMVVDERRPSSNRSTGRPRT